MHGFKSGLLALMLSLGTSSLALAIEVTPGLSTEPWLGFMNVYNLPAPDGDGAFQFASAWGVADLVATFDDANSLLTLTPNTIGDPNEYWYQPGRPGDDPLDPNDNGGPGALGNKIMEANLYIEETDVLNGQTVDFTYNVVSDTTSSYHEGFAFIRDFAPDYSSFTETITPLSAGSNTISLATDPGLGRHVQYGFQFIGVNVWATDVVSFGYGSIVIGPDGGGPTPLLGDADGDGDVDGDDLIAVQTNFGSVMPPPGDADNDGDVDGDDLIAVQTNFGNTQAPSATAAAVPEPSTIALLGMACATLAVRKRS